MVSGILNRALLRRCKVALPSDVYERAADAGRWLPAIGERRHRLAMIDRARTLFIHIPKNAGTSISHALYGAQIQHATIRHYARTAPRLLWRTPSFAVLRDPIARFASAFHHAQAGGCGATQLAAPWRDRYRAFATIDEALDHLERAADIYAIDPIFRPQSGYVTDRGGTVLVDRLFLFDAFDGVRHFLGLRDIAAIPHFNRCEACPLDMTAAQIARIRRFYRRDFQLVQALRETATQQLPSLRDLPMFIDEPEAQRLAG